MRRLALVAAAACLAVTPRHASSDPTGDPGAGAFAVRVTASALNVRDAPSTGGAQVGQAAQGQVFAAVAKSGSWFRIWFGARTGWVHGGYLANDAAKVARVTASSLNVRSGPGTGNAVLGTVPSGAVFAVRGTSGDWVRIDFGGRAGWLHGGYVTTGNGGTGGGNTGGTVSAAGFISLAPSGAGFYSVAPESRRWGTPRMVHGLERIFRRWSSERPAGTSPRIAIGDISAKNGGKISGHASHQRGVDVDIQLPRNDGQESPRVDRFKTAYSRTGTQKVVNLCRAEMSVTHVFFNDPKVTGVSKWPNHDNHLHVRIK